MKDMTDEPQTCGKGLVEHSTLPAKLSELLAAMAQILDLHKNAIDASTEEFEAYAKLTNEFRDVAARLRAIGKQMAGYRDLPMPAHDMQALMDAKNVEAFIAYIAREKELLEYLQNAIARDEAMMRG